MKKSILISKTKHSETFMIALFFGMLIGAVIPKIWLLAPLLIVVILGMTASVMMRPLHGAYRRKGNYVQRVNPVQARRRRRVVP